MAANAAITRVDKVRRFVELDALNLLVNNVMVETEFFDVSDVLVSDLDETMRELWPGREIEEQSSVEYHLADAEMCALYVRVMSWLRSDEGQEFCASQALRLGRHGEDALRKARELVLDAS